MCAFIKAVSEAQLNSDICNTEHLLRAVQTVMQGIRLVGAAFDVEVDDNFVTKQDGLDQRFGAQNAAIAGVQQAQGALLQLVQAQRRAAVALVEHCEAREDQAHQLTVRWQEAFKQLETAKDATQEQNIKLTRLVKRLDFEASEHEMQVKWLVEDNGLAVIKAADTIGTLRDKIGWMRASWHSDKEVNYLNLVCK